MRPGDIVRPVVTVKNSTTGAVVTGLVTAGFTVDYYLDATTPAAAINCGCHGTMNEFSRLAA